MSVKKEAKKLLVVRTAPPPHIYTVVLLSSLMADNYHVGIFEEAAFALFGATHEDSGSSWLNILAKHKTTADSEEHLSRTLRKPIKIVEYPRTGTEAEREECIEASRKALADWWLESDDEANSERGPEEEDEEALIGEFVRVSGAEMNDFIQNGGLEVAG